MLHQLVIRNFAIIDDLTVTFSPGLNALTGETGAGKSILIDALGMVLGGRSDAAAVRSGSQRATIDAEFHLDDVTSTRFADRMEEHGLEKGDVLLLTREIQPSGRSSARINGRPVTIATLGAFGDLLVDIHGQSEHLSLLKRSHQREILDSWGVERSLTSGVAEQVVAWKSTLRALESLSRTARETAQRVDLLRFQLDEIDAASLAVGEDDALDQEFARLSQIDRLAGDVQLALNLLDPVEPQGGNDADGVLASLRSVDKALSSIAEIDRSLRPIADQLRDAQFALEDVGLGLRRYLDALEADPARLEIVADRIARLRDLKRKYGTTIAEVLEFRSAAEAELELLTGSSYDEEKLREIAETQEVKLGSSLHQLSGARRQAASTLMLAVRKVISDLQLGNASFAIDVRSRTSVEGKLDPSLVDESGLDDIEFTFAPNEGEQPRPLARIASGGEMARVMLALKTTLAGADSIPTYVFDEVDVGVGGRSGTVVGEKLFQLSASRQVLVISHLAQVAVFADRHLRIRKEVDTGRTHSVIEELDEGARIEELAAMLYGEPPTDASRETARQMLEQVDSAVRTAN